MTIVKQSKKKPHLINNNSQLNHWTRKILQMLPQIATSYKPKTDKQKLRKIENVETKQAPLVPIKRPNKAQEMKLKKGKDNKHKYIGK